MNTKKKIVTFGEIMLRLATPGYLRFSQANELTATFGGGEANVAVSLANYGMDTDYITRLPKNDIAQACIQDLRGRGDGNAASCFRCPDTVCQPDRLFGGARRWWPSRREAR